MAIFNCKMCGGDLKIVEGKTIAECKYCGTQQTLPKLDDDKRAILYDRANHFRRNNDFDKAIVIYEKILNEDNTDAEAYWSLVLCRYGIEYVEDPSTKKRIPTVNRAQFTSIFDDENYRSALQYADQSQYAIYEAEAKAINDIQKSILAISQKEEPFDVFICYKETDERGRRTPDSVLAQELYYGLKNEGFKVFFARITLEDKLGTAYEPYIFAALNSAKVMVVIGTKPEFFNAAWVKNEWSRYLSLIKQGQKKILIPAYKNMDPYDLPEEFSHLQAQDMSKLGFMQDLIRGIKKIAKASEPKQTTVIRETVAVPNASAPLNIEPLIERAFLFLEDGDWNSADEYCEKVLDQDPKNAHAYLAKLMAELHVSKKTDLQDLDQPFDSNNNYQKIIRFGDDALKATLIDYIDHINTRNHQARLESVFKYALNEMNAASGEQDYLVAAKAFEEIQEYRNAAELHAKCLEKAEEARLKVEAERKDAAYIRAKSMMLTNDITSLNEARKIFENLGAWKDSPEQVRICQKRIADKMEADRLEEELLDEIERKKEKKSKIIGWSTFIGILLVAVIIAVGYFQTNYTSKYNSDDSRVEILDLWQHFQCDDVYFYVRSSSDTNYNLSKINKAINN